MFLRLGELTERRPARRVTGLSSTTARSPELVPVDAKVLKAYTGQWLAKITKQALFAAAGAATMWVLPKVSQSFA